KLGCDIQNKCSSCRSDSVSTKENSTNYYNTNHRHCQCFLVFSNPIVNRGIIRRWILHICIKGIFECDGKFCGSRNLGGGVIHIEEECGDRNTKLLVDDIK